MARLSKATTVRALIVPLMICDDPVQVVELNIRIEKELIFVHTKVAASGDIREEGALNTGGRRNAADVAGLAVGSEVGAADGQRGGGPDEAVGQVIVDAGLEDGDGFRGEGGGGSLGDSGGGGRAGNGRGEGRVNESKESEGVEHHAGV